MKTVATKLEPDVLEKVWRTWLTENTYTKNQKNIPFHYTTRRMNEVQRFESWLFAQGATVKQINRKRYLIFNEPEQATLFVLKWT